MTDAVECQQDTPPQVPEPRASAVRAIAVVDKQARALELRRQGKTYAVIAAEVGYADESGAYRAVLAAIKSTMTEAGVEEARALELARLDTLLERWLPAAVSTEGELEDARAATEIVLKIAKRRSDLLGLDAPRRVEASLSVGGQPATEAQFVAYLRSLPDDELERHLLAAGDRS